MMVKILYLSLLVCCCNNGESTSRLGTKFKFQSIWVIMMYQCGPIKYNKCTLVVGEVDSGGAMNMQEGL